MFVLFCLFFVLRRISGLTNRIAQTNNSFIQRRENRRTLNPIKPTQNRIVHPRENSRTTNPIVQIELRLSRREGNYVLRGAPTLDHVFA